MNQYLVLYRNKDGNCFQSIKIWPEIEKMLRKLEEVGGGMRIFRLNGMNHPELMRVCHEDDAYWLEPINRIQLRW